MKKRKGVYNGNIEEVFEYAFLKKKDLLVKGTGIIFQSNNPPLNYYDEEYVEFKHKYVRKLKNNINFSCELIVRPRTDSLLIGKFEFCYDDLIDNKSLYESITEIITQLKEIAINGKFDEIIIWSLKDSRIIDYFLKENWRRRFKNTYIYEIKDEKEN